MWDFTFTAILQLPYCEVIQSTSIDIFHTIINHLIIVFKIKPLKKTAFMLYIDFCLKCVIHSEEQANCEGYLTGRFMIKSGSCITDNIANREFPE